VGIIKELEFDNAPLLSRLPHLFSFFFPHADHATREERGEPPDNFGNTTIPVEDDGLYNEIVTRFWHPDLTRNFKLEMDTGKMDLVAEIEREPGKDVLVRLGGGRAG